MRHTDEDYLVRRATQDDAEVIIRGIETICVEGGAFYTTYFVASPQWERVLFDPTAAPDHLLIIAEWKGQFVGAGRLFPGEHNTLFRHVAELGMFVLRPYRRRGIGTTLLGWMLAWAAGAGLEKITLTVFATNTAAIRLYQKFGFVEEGRQQRHLKIGDRYIDRLLMAYFLETSA